MKFVLMVPDGAADHPIPELDGKTPLEAARTPVMDRLASEGRVGTSAVIPEGMPPGSDVGNMSIMGYNPRQYYSGRGPIEAIAMGLCLGPRDVAFRCNLIATDGQRMLDHSGGNLSSDDARALFEIVDGKLGGGGIRFYPGVGYRGQMVWQSGPTEVRCQPPHDILDKPLMDNLPTGDQEDRLRQMIWDSLEILDSHELNKRARGEGRLPANLIWPWGQGRAPSFPTFATTWGVTGCVISAVDLIRGLGVCSGLKVIQVPGATGWIDTNYRGKAEYALRALRDLDFAMVHVEAPDECGHRGDYALKVEAIERFDRDVVGTLMEGLGALGPSRVLIMPDHPTPCSLRTHSSEPVPFILWASDGSASAGKHARLTEMSGREDGVGHLDEGFRTIELLFGRRPRASIATGPA